MLEKLKINSLYKDACTVYITNVLETQSRSTCTLKSNVRSRGLQREQITYKELEKTRKQL